MRTEGFVSVMTEKLTGFNTIREIGVGLLIQIVILGALYAMLNSAKIHNLLGFSGQVLDQEDFAISIAIAIGFTLHHVYRKKQAFIKKRLSDQAKKPAN